MKNPQQVKVWHDVWEWFHKWTGRCPEWWMDALEYIEEDTS